MSLFTTSQSENTASILNIKLIILNTLLCCNAWTCGVAHGVRELEMLGTHKASETEYGNKHDDTVNRKPKGDGHAPLGSH